MRTTRTGTLGAADQVIALSRLDIVERMVGFLDAQKYGVGFLLGFFRGLLVGVMLLRKLQVCLADFLGGTSGRQAQLRVVTGGSSSRRHGGRIRV